ncbi:MAG: DUF4440 domain-containing protein [Methanotrichaceae archaeon]|nr:DUF4440 domain-containing protein [Methanotrichaceae archaeon]
MNSDEIKTAIDKANKKFEEGFLKSDASITASGFADDAVIFPPDAGMIQGKKAIEDFWGTVMASGVKGVSLNTVEVSASGDFAVERGTGVLEIRPASGAPSEQNIKYVVVWKRTAEGLKNMWDIWNASP